MGDTGPCERRCAGSRPGHVLISEQSIYTWLFPCPRSSAHPWYRNICSSLQKPGGHRPKPEQGPVFEVQQKAGVAAFLQLQSMHRRGGRQHTCLTGRLALLGRCRRSVEPCRYQAGSEVFRVRGGRLDRGGRGAGTRGWPWAGPFRGYSSPEVAGVETAFKETRRRRIRAPWGGWSNRAYRACKKGSQGTGPVKREALADPQPTKRAKSRDKAPSQAGDPKGKGVGTSSTPQPALPAEKIQKLREDLQRSKAKIGGDRPGCWDSPGSGGDEESEGDQPQGYKRWYLERASSAADQASGRYPSSRFQCSRQQDEGRGHQEAAGQESREEALPGKGEGHRQGQEGEKEKEEEAPTWEEEKEEERQEAEEEEKGDPFRWEDCKLLQQLQCKFSNAVSFGGRESFGGSIEAEVTQGARISAEHAAGSCVRAASTECRSGHAGDSPWRSDIRSQSHDLPLPDHQAAVQSSFEGAPRAAHAGVDNGPSSTRPTGKARGCPSGEIRCDSPELAGRFMGVGAAPRGSSHARGSGPRRRCTIGGKEAWEAGHESPRHQCLLASGQRPRKRKLVERSGQRRRLVLARIQRQRKERQEGKKQEQKGKGWGRRRWRSKSRQVRADGYEIQEAELVHTVLESQQQSTVDSRGLEIFLQALAKISTLAQAGCFGAWLIANAGDSEPNGLSLVVRKVVFEHCWHPQVTPKKGVIFPLRYFSG